MISNKITILELTAFRGVPGTIALDFQSPSTGKPASLLLIGDNASGKSTIVDATFFLCLLSDAMLCTGELYVLAFFPEITGSTLADMAG